MHSGVLGEADGAKGLAVWIYDCGTVSSKATLSRELDVLRDRHGSHVDLLYLSHFHEDHVNGLSNLKQGFSVDRAFIPLLDPWERLLAFGSWRGNPPSWYVQFIADPAAWMGQWADSVFEVAPGSTDPLTSVDAEEVAPLDDSEGDLQPPDGTGGVVTASNATVAYGATGRAVWVWEPYVLNSVDALRIRFQREFQLLFGSDPVALSGDDVLGLLGDQRARGHLRTIYKNLLEGAGQGEDLNLTSMCLYSGTTVPPRGCWRSRWPETYLVDPNDPTEAIELWRDRSEVGVWGQGTGWLLTGDGSLRDSSRALEVRRYYSARYEAVGVLALPHHGSERSYNPTLLNDLESRSHCLASVSTTNSFGHPSRLVNLDVQNRGCHLVVVTGNAESRFSDVLRIRA